MSYVGKGSIGTVYTSVSPNSSGKFSAIGTDSGLTLHGILIAQGTGAFVASNALGNGQVLIGSNGSNPIAGNLTAGPGITITNGAGVITIGVTTGTTVIETITGDTGGALSPTAGNINILSTTTNGIDTSGSGSTLTVGMATPYADGDFEFRSAVSGATRKLSITNTVDAASSQAQVTTSVAGGSSGDTWHQFTIGSTTSYAIGLDNSDSDKLKITYAASATATPSDANPFLTFDPVNGDVTQLSSINQTAGYQVQNTSDTAAAQAQYSGIITVSTGSNAFNLGAINPASSDARAAGRVELQTTLQSLGLNLAGINAAGTATMRMYVGTSGAATLSANCTAAGEWTYPVQPAFRAYLSADALNVTGDGTAYTIAYNTESYDQNSDFDNTTFTFTAPVTGIYHFDVTTFLNGIVSANIVDLKITNTAGTSIQQLSRTAGVGVQSNNGYAISSSCSIKMTAADTAKVVLIANGEAGKIVDVQSGTMSTTFAGYLEG